MQKRKMINKICIVIGSLLISVAILSTYLIICNKQSDLEETESIINDLFTDTSTQVEETTEITPIVDNTPKKEFVLTDSYLGYIEFPNYGIKRLITTGTTKKVLDKNLVGTLSVSANLDDEYGNVILAGHSTSNVFQKLHYMKIGDQIKIVTHQNTYNFVIVSKNTIRDDDMSYFMSVYDKKQLTLITCKNNGKQRLIVVAELRG